METPKKKPASLGRRLVRFDGSHERPAPPRTLDRFRTVLVRKPRKS